MLIGPHCQIKNLQTFPFTKNMDKRGFGYDGFSDKITTHGRSHLSLIRESYQKKWSKKKITAVNLKVAFTAGFCLCWLLSFLPFLASVFSFFCQISLIFFKLFYHLLLCLPLIHAFLSSSSLSSTYINSLLFCFPIFHSSSTYIFSCSTFIKLSRIVSYILFFFTWSFNGSWVLCFFIYILFEDLGYLLCELD